MHRRDDGQEKRESRKESVGKVMVSASDEIARNPKAARAFAALKEAGLTDQHARGGRLHA